jgi:hypothetical protein
MELIQSKSLLAKLMATENLIVEQRNVSTASFNVKDRVLTLPILDKNISSELYDLLVGHEVGHALWTDQELLIRGIELKIARSVMNVIEDVRIERKIKNKYPGIRSSFIKGYRELIEKDFFGTAGVDLNDLNFIDRVNLYSKGGANAGIKFIEVERNLLNEIESTETPDDVIAVSKKVMEYLKEEKEEKKKQNPQQVDEESEDELDESDSDSYDDESDYGDEEGDGFNQSSSDDEFDEEDGDESETDNTGSQADSGDKEDSEPQENTGSEAGSKSEELKSHTDENFRQNENKLYVDDSRTYYYGNVPNIPTKDVIVPHKVLWNRYREFFADLEQRKFYHYNTDHSDASKKFQKLRTEANKVVSYLAKEFELRKNADQLKRASTSKTGDLNMNKIFSYKFNEDIFKKITVIPGGKSHGLVMFIDWSGSMSDHLQNTMKQLINLVMFCKKVNIPYEVYAFTDNYDDNFRAIQKEGDICLGEFKLLNMLSSKMSASEFSYAAAALVRYSTERRCIAPSWFCLGGTPLNEAVMAAMNVVPEFQKTYKLQIVNTVFLTDGEGANNCTTWTDHGNGLLVEGYGKEDTNSYARWKRYFTIRDPITKHQQVAGTDSNRYLTAHYIKLLKSRTNCNIVGFYVLSGRELGRNLNSFFGSAADSSKLKATFRKEKSLTVTSSGYDEYYLLRSEGLDTEEETELEVKENATTRGLVSAFTKFSGGRQSSRVVLNRFINMIA